MNEYEFFIEDINLRAGTKTKEYIEAVSPEAYVRGNGRFPILEITKNFG